MGIIEVIAGALKLIVLIFAEWAQAQQRAREAAKKEEQYQFSFNQLAIAAVAKMQANTRKDSKDAADVDKQLDEARKKINPNP